MSNPVQTDSAQFFVEKFYNESPKSSFFQTEKKVHSLGLALIVVSIMALSVVVYFGLTRNFNNIRIMVAGASSLILLITGIFFLKREFWKDPLFVQKKQNLAIPLLLENGVSAFAARYGRDATKIINKKQMCEILSRPIKLNMSASDQNRWGITTGEAEKIVICRHFFNVKNQFDVGHIKTAADFVKACNHFEPNHHYKENMDYLFNLVDPQKKLRNILMKDAKTLIESLGFVKFASQCQDLERQIGWSFFKLLDNARELVAGHLLTLQDFSEINNYWDVAKHYLPEEVLDGVDKINPDLDLLKANWDKFQNSESYASSHKGKSFASYGT